MTVAAAEVAVGLALIVYFTGAPVRCWPTTTVI